MTTYAERNEMAMELAGVTERRKAARGTSNKNVSGNAEDRRRRRAWLLETYRADVDSDGLRRIGSAELFGVKLGEGESCCRCYRCGRLLTIETLEVDRIIPGCLGGTYRRNNIRPVCGPCNRITGNAAKAVKAATPRKRKAKR